MNNIDLIYLEVSKNHNEFIVYDSQYLRLIGYAETFDDYYYLAKNNNNEIKYILCLENIKYLRNHIIKKKLDRIIIEEEKKGNLPEDKIVFLQPQILNRI